MKKFSIVLVLLVCGVTCGTIINSMESATESANFPTIEEECDCPPYETLVPYEEDRARREQKISDLLNGKIERNETTVVFVTPKNQSNK